MQIYILIDGQPQGPYTPEDVRKYLKTGQLQPADLGAYAGSSDWKPLESMVKSWGATARYSGAPPPSSSGAKTKRTLILTTTAIVIALVAVVSGIFLYSHRHQPDIQGAWEGTVAMPGGIKVRVVLHLSGTNGNYHATSDCIEARLSAAPIDKFIYSFPSVKLVSKDAGTYQATLNSSFDEMSGLWQQAGLTNTVTLKRTATPDAIPELLAENDYASKTGSDLQGYWLGTLKAGSVALRLAFKIAESDGGHYIAELDSLDQGANNLVVSPVTYDKPKVRMEVGLVGGVFQGTASSDGTEIVGTWTQAGHPLPLTIERTDIKVLKAAQLAASAQEASKDYLPSGPDDLTGHWRGALSINGTKLHLALHVAQLASGGFSGALDSLDQGVTGLAATNVRFTAPSVHLGWATIGGTFDGKIQDGKITGKWRQGGKAFPLVFERNRS